jgi:hypothetical protein
MCGLPTVDGMNVLKVGPKFLMDYHFALQKANFFQVQYTTIRTIYN